MVSLINSPNDEWQYIAGPTPLTFKTIQQFTTKNKKVKEIRMKIKKILGQTGGYFMQKAIFFGGERY